MKKELCLSSDFYDDLLRSGMRLEPGHLDDMMRYAASLGTTRFEWVVDTLWNLYDQGNVLGYDLLKTACDAAHRHGMRFDAVYKPFEGGLGGPKMTLPLSMPHDSIDRVIQDDTGLRYAVRQFIAQNPQYCIARKPGDGQDPGGRLAEIRLVKSNESEIRFSPEDISFWYSKTNGNFQKYQGPLNTSIIKEWRLGYPYSDEQNTLMCFKGFDLPSDVRYFEIRCAKTSPDGSFANAIESIIELVNEHGQVIPCSPSTEKPKPDSVYSLAKKISDLGITDYLNKPQIKALLDNQETFNQHWEANCKGMYVFSPQWEVFTLDGPKSGVIAVHRGKPMHHPSCLHPIYPEVRQHWLDQVQYCIDRGVDGVNIRISRHGCMNEPWAYGFNEPVMRELKHHDDRHEAATINGRAFDTFMKEAAQLLHSQGREIGVHLCGLILGATDKFMALPKPATFNWNWEMWVRDLVDYTEFHKTFFYKFDRAKHIINHFGSVVSETGKPFIYQSGQSGAMTQYHGPHRCLPMEMQWVKDHHYLTCYNLYETASFFQINEEGRYQGSPDIKALVKNHWA